MLVRKVVLEGVWDFRDRTIPASLTFEWELQSDDVLTTARFSGGDGQLVHSGNEPFGDDWIFEINDVSLLAGFIACNKHLSINLPYRFYDKPSFYPMTLIAFQECMGIALQFNLSRMKYDGVDSHVSVWFGSGRWGSFYVQERSLLDWSEELRNVFYWLMEESEKWNAAHGEEQELL